MFHFKSFAIAGLAAVTLSACLDATGVSAIGADRRVVIENRTGQTIWRFYGSRASTSSWEEDILGSSVLPNGDAIRINFDDGTGACIFDMKAVFRDGSSIEEYGIDVCRTASITFR